jgi:hypothetical protein
MLSLKHNFTYKYPSSNLKRVYYPSTGERYTYYSVQKNNKNILVFFEHTGLIKMPEKSDTPSRPCVINSTDIEEMHHISKLLNMPAVVVLNTYCDIDDRKQMYDIFYTQTKSVSI